MHHNAIVHYLAAVQEAERLCKGDQQALHLLQSLECWCPRDFLGLRTGCCGNHVYVPARSQKSFIKFDRPSNNARGKRLS